jgi:hypothetical protein
MLFVIAVGQSGIFGFRGVKNARGMVCALTKAIAAERATIANVNRMIVGIGDGRLGRVLGAVVEGERGTIKGYLGGAVEFICKKRHHSSPARGTN